MPLSGNRPTRELHAAHAAWKNDFTDDDQEIRFSYRRTSSNSGDPPRRVSVYARFVDWDNYIRVEFFANNTCRVLEKVSGTATVIATGTAASTTNTWYDVRIVCDDTSVKAYHKTGENLESLVLSATVAVTTSNSISIVTWSNTTADLDTIWLIGDSLSNTTTFAVNNANELTTMTDPNGTTSFGFDAWGRMTTKARGSYEAKYGYRYGQMLTSVDSDWPGEADASYEYTGQGKRRERSTSSQIRRFKHVAGYRVVDVESNVGDLVGMYVGSTLAYADGSNLGSGQYDYFVQDTLGSTRELRDQSTAKLAEYEYSPFGQRLSYEGPALDRGFAGMEFEDHSNLYFTPFRNYASPLAQWIARDPTGFADGLNLFSYVRRNPTNLADPLGTYACKHNGKVYEYVSGFDRPTYEACYKDCMGPPSDIAIFGGFAVANLPRFVNACGETFATIAVSSGVANGIGWIGSCLVVATSMTCQYQCTRAASGPGRFVYRPDWPATYVEVRRSCDPLTLECREEVIERPVTLPDCRNMRPGDWSSGPPWPRW